MKKRFFVVLVSVMFVIGVTYAWHSWTSSNNTNVSFTLGEMTITYSAGADISGVKLLPVTSLEKGLSDGIAIEKTITVSSSSGTAYLDLNMDIEILESGLKHETFVYQVKKGNDVVTSGNFANYDVGDTINLLSGEQVNTTTSTYKLYIWIDGRYDNPLSMGDQDYKFVLKASATSEVAEVAADKIISLSRGDTYTQGNGNGVYATNAYDDNGVTKYHEYRYVGAEPDNWVRYNDDDYRIIGVFDDNSHGVEGEYLVKLIAANALAATSWGTYNSAPAYTMRSSVKNNWDGLDSNGTTTNGTGVPANLNVLLNEYFLNPTATSTYGECVNWIYASYSQTSKNCSNIKGYGIQTTSLRDYIQPVTWYLYGYGSNLNKANWYQCERNNYIGCTSANSGAYSGTTTASIGLMYVSDYFYASGYVASNDIQTTSGAQDLIVLNWLYNGIEWTITPRGDSNDLVFNISGYVNKNNGSHLSFSFRPTFYLKSTVKIKSGNGTYNNPYVIG